MLAVIMTVLVVAGCNRVKNQANDAKKEALKKLEEVKNLDEDVDKLIDDAMGEIEEQEAEIDSVASSENTEEECVKEEADEEATN